MRCMEKIALPAILIVFALLIICIISVGNKAEIKETKRVLEELDGLMEYSLPEGWEIKIGSATAKYTTFGQFIGNISIGEIGIDDGEWIEDCINISIDYDKSITVPEIRENLELNFGDSHDYYTFDSVEIIDGEKAYYGTRKRDNSISKEIHFVHDRWSVDLYLTSDGEILDEHVNALYEFAESIDFK